MKVSLMMSMVVLFILSSACVEVKTKDSSDTAGKTTSTLKITKLKTKRTDFKVDGYRCDLATNNGHKEIFLYFWKVDKEFTKDNKEMKLINLMDLSSEGKIRFDHKLAIDDYMSTQLMHQTSGENDDLVYRTILTKENKDNNLSEDEKVLIINGRLTLNKSEMTGIIESNSVTKKDEVVKTTEFQEIARIQNCETFTATYSENMIQK